jgi:tyrosyl-tRNA synthetase
MTEGDGMSFAEFTYPLLQGWDFWHLYNKLGVQMQVGGSDQFGNIVTGVETVKTVRASEEAPHLKMPETWSDDPVGFTVPLLTDSAGVKFGKSAGNAIWLDPFMTSAFDLYGYFVRRPDNDVEKLLKLFTFLPLPDIQKLMGQHRLDPRKRLAQHTLAFEVLSLIHGADVAIREQQQHQFMYSKSTGAPSLATGEAQYTPIEGHPTTLNNAPKPEIQLPESLIMGGKIAKIIHAAGLASSTSEANRLCQQQGAYVAAAPGKDMRGLAPGSLDWTPVKTWFPEDTQNFLIDGRILILRKGKHFVRIIEMVSDVEWRASKQTYPGEPGTGKVHMMLKTVKEEAEAEGLKLTNREIRDRLAKKMEQSEKIVKVHNNPAIEFPSKKEKAEQQKAEPAPKTEES